MQGVPETARASPLGTFFGGHKFESPLHAKADLADFGAFPAPFWISVYERRTGTATMLVDPTADNVAHAVIDDVDDSGSVEAL